MKNNERDNTEIAVSLFKLPTTFVVADHMFQSTSCKFFLTENFLSNMA